MDNLSERLLALRLQNKVLIKDIIESTGISLRSYQYYERNERKPTSDVIIKLCTYFNVSADYLLGLSDDPTRH